MFEFDHSHPHLNSNTHPFGEMPERSNGAVSKTVDPVRGPGVRIPLSPPAPKPAVRHFFSFYENQKLVFVFHKKKKNGHEVAGFW